MSGDEPPSFESDADGLERFLQRAGPDLYRLIAVSPRAEGAAPYVDSVFASVGRPVPAVLVGWDDQIDLWCSDYRAEFGRDVDIVEVNLGSSVFVFDRTYERVLLAYGVATPPVGTRDNRRMRRFPDVNVGVRANLGDDAFVADRGHFLAHGAGGDLDINLFPQRRELNRGWSSEGKSFRRMEAYIASRPGSFHAHRALYDDATWIPSRLEYGILVDDQRWWIGRFANKAGA